MASVTRRVGDLHRILPQLADDRMGYLLAVFGLMLQLVDAAGDALGDPAIKDQVSAAVGDPAWAGRVLLVISIITLAARLRSVRKQS
jgi:hypothetical protein